MAAGVKFIQTQRYDLRASLGLTIGGIPAVLIAGLMVRSLSLTAVRWLVVCVVIYTGVTMLRSARRETRTLARDSALSGR